MTSNKKTARFITWSAVIAAIYVVLTVVFAPISFNVGQIRIAEMLTILPLFTPAAIPGLFIGCILGNLLGGAIVLDIVFGSIATLIGAVGGYLLRKNRWLVPIPAVISNGIIVPIILKYGYGRKYLLSIIITFLILGLCWWYFFGRGNSGVKPDDTDPAPAVNVDPTADEDYIRAKQALEDGDSETAFNILSGLLDKYPNNSEVFALFWEACKQNMLSSISEKDYGAAELYVNLLATLDPDNADELYRNFYNVWLSDLAQGNADGDMREVLEKPHGSGTTSPAALLPIRRSTSWSICGCRYRSSERERST